MFVERNRPGTGTEPLFVSYLMVGTVLVLRIRDISVRIRIRVLIRGSVSLTN
jgi:hypothetical protein